MISKLLGRCLTEPQAYLGILTVSAGEDKKAKLEFFQNTEFRIIDLFTIDFDETPEDIVRQHITFRINSMKSKTMIMQERLKDI